MADEGDYAGAVLLFDSSEDRQLVANHVENQPVETANTKKP